MVDRLAAIFLLFLAILSSFVGPSAIPGCPTCDLLFNGTCYSHFSDLKTWHDANSSCYDWGGNLVSNYPYHFSILHDSTNSWNSQKSDRLCGYYTADGELSSIDCSRNFTYGCIRPISCNTECELFYDGRCYSGNFSVTRTHTQAADSCVESGSYLASILSPLIPQIFQALDRIYWIGLRDIFSNETFEWIDGSEVVYTNFYYNLNYTNTTSNSTNMPVTECILAGYEGSRNWTYADCDSTYSYLCSAGVITSPPYNFASSAITDSSLLLSWDEIPLIDRFAPILGYIVEYYGISSDATERKIQFESDSLNVTVDDLQSNVTYNFTIRANGVLGDGPVSDIQITTPFKELTTSIRNLTQLFVTSTTSVIQWLRPVLTPAHGSIQSYTIEVLDQDDELLIQSTSVYTSYSISDLSPYSNYSVEVYANSTAGQSPSATIQIQTLEDVPSTGPRNFTLSTLNSTALQASWSPPLISDRNGVITTYYITVTVASQEVYMTERNIQVSESVSSVELSGLEEYTRYGVVLTAATSVGKGPEINATARTDAAVPTGEVQNLTVIEVDSRGVVVSWSPPAVSLQNGEINGYRIVTRRDSTVVLNITTTSACYSISDLYPHINYSVSVSPINSEGEGPSLSIYQYTESEGKYSFDN
ncbi:hypothetical protein LOD99_13700 [Oopsacas minuta]|uniref:Uncharacterized protein n=1 Tax=Oopsacas minuta TaxID=111878 RepID=A0AAV7KI21_9METZ|nr:hypothetical protein LOD99_13700 [Oopsacas minuta]